MKYLGVDVQFTVFKMMTATYFTVDCFRGIKLERGKESIPCRFVSLRDFDVLAVVNVYIIDMYSLKRMDER